MRVYLDASVVVALVSDEAFSQRAEQLLSRPDLVPVFSDFASAEATSALARRVRTGGMQPHHASIAFEQLDDWAARVPERASLEPRDIAHAEAMIRTLDLSLRTPDAINLAWLSGLRRAWPRSIGSLRELQRRKACPSSLSRGWRRLA